MDRAEHAERRGAHRAPAAAQQQQQHTHIHTNVSRACTTPRAAAGIASSPNTPYTPARRPDECRAENARGRAAFGGGSDEEHGEGGGGGAGEVDGGERRKGGTGNSSHEAGEGAGPEGEEGSLDRGLEEDEPSGLRRGAAHARMRLQMPRCLLAEGAPPTSR